jgi:hypothetical protein
LYNVSILDRSIPRRKAMLAIAVTLVLLVLFDFAAWKWGVDSREGITDTHSGTRYRAF